MASRRPAEPARSHDQIFTSDKEIKIRQFERLVTSLGKLDEDGKFERLSTLYPDPGSRMILWQEAYALREECMKDSLLIFQELRRFNSDYKEETAENILENLKGSRDLLVQQLSQNEDGASQLHVGSPAEPKTVAEAVDVTELRVQLSTLEEEIKYCEDLVRIQKILKNLKEIIPVLCEFTLYYQVLGLGSKSIADFALQIRAYKSGVEEFNKQKAELVQLNRAAVSDERAMATAYNPKVGLGRSGQLIGELIKLIPGESSLFSGDPETIRKAIDRALPEKRSLLKSIGGDRETEHLAKRARALELFEEFIHDLELYEIGIVKDKSARDKFRDTVSKLAHLQEQIRMYKVVFGRIHRVYDMGAENVRSVDALVKSIPSNSPDWQEYYNAVPWEAN